PDEAALQAVPAPQLLFDHQAPRAFVRGHDRFVDLRIERLTHRRHDLEPLVVEDRQQLLPGAVHACQELLFRLGRRLEGQGGVEGVEDGEELGDQPLGGPLGGLSDLPGGAAAVVVEVGCDPFQVVEVGRRLLAGLLDLPQEVADRLLWVPGQHQAEAVGSRPSIRVVYHRARLVDLVLFWLGSFLGPAPVSSIGGAAGGPGGPPAFPTELSSPSSTLSASTTSSSSAVPPSAPPPACAWAC